MQSNIPQFELWLETEIEEVGYQSAIRSSENFCNVVVRLQDGRCYALNVWTFDFLA